MSTRSIQVIVCLQSGLNFCHLTILIIRFLTTALVQTPDSAGIHPHSASEHSAASPSDSPQVQAQICLQKEEQLEGLSPSKKTIQSPTVLQVKVASPDKMLQNGEDSKSSDKSLAFGSPVLQSIHGEGCPEDYPSSASFEHHLQDHDTFSILTCSSLMQPRVGVWGGGGGGGGSGVGVGHPPPPPFPSPGPATNMRSRSSSRRGSFSTTIAPEDLSEHCLEVAGASLNDSSTDLQNLAHMLSTPLASAGADTLALTPDLPQEERDKRASERERCIALLKEQLTDQPVPPADDNHGLTEVRTCSNIFEVPPAATPVERSTQGVHDEDVVDHDTNLYDSLPLVRSGEDEGPVVCDVRICSDLRGICMSECVDEYACVYVCVLSMHAHAVLLPVRPCMRTR